MDLMWLAISVTVFVGDDGQGMPNVNVIPQGYYASEAECSKWRQNRYQNPWGSIDPATGRAVAAYYYECTPQDKNREITQR